MLRSASKYPLAFSMIHQSGKHTAVFDKAWFAAIYAGTPAESMAAGWWNDVATANGDHVCPVKLMKVAEDLIVSATACSDWINQNVAHLDRNASVPTPTFLAYGVVGILVMTVYAEGARDGARASAAVLHDHEVDDGVGQNGQRNHGAKLAGTEFSGKVD